MQGLSEGRIVHYVMPNGEHRPAIVVRKWPADTYPVDEGVCNLQVFTDCGNDCTEENKKWFPDTDIRSGRLWATSIKHDAGYAPHTWHWPERE